jgi:hypothetical protein
MIFLTAVMAAATVAMAIFNGQLVGVTKDMKKATEAALDINRPFLLVTNINLNQPLSYDVETDFYNFCFRIEIKNFGISPADIIDYIANAEPLDPPKFPDRKDDPSISYGPNEGQQINDSIIRHGETSSFRLLVGTEVNETGYQVLKKDEKRMAIHGRIRYRGASERVFYTFFFWWCFCDSEPLQFARALTKELNDHT